MKGTEMELKSCQRFVGGLLIGAVCIIGLATCNPVEAQGITISMYQKQGVTAPFCLNQADAVEIAMADSNDGFEKAKEVFSAKDDCVYGGLEVKPVRPIFSAKTERGATVRVIEVEYELDLEGGLTTIRLYIVTDVPVDGLQSA